MELTRQSKRKRESGIEKRRQDKTICQDDIDSDVNHHYIQHEYEPFEAYVQNNLF